MTVLWRAVVRTVPFLLVFWLVRYLPVPADVVGENVGLGLLVFGLTVGYVAVWAALDARALPVGLALRVWATTAGLLGLLQPVLGVIDGHHRYGLGQARTDLTNLSLFMFVLVALFTAVPVLIVDRVRSAEPEETATAPEPAVAPAAERPRVGRHAAGVARARTASPGSPGRAEVVAAPEPVGSPSRGRHAAPVPERGRPGPARPLPDAAPAASTAPAAVGRHAAGVGERPGPPAVGRHSAARAQDLAVPPAQVVPAPPAAAPPEHPNPVSRGRHAAAPSGRRAPSRGGRHAAATGGRRQREDAGATAGAI